MLSGFLLTAMLASAQTFQVPNLKAHINDYSQVISNQTESQLNGILDRIKVDTGIEMAVLTVDSLGGLPIEMASIQVVDQWKLGTAREDKGLLLMLAIKDRKLRIEVGQGLEGTLTDADSSQIIDQFIVPLLKQNDIDGAVVAGTFEMLRRAAPDVNIEGYFDNTVVPQPRRKKDWSGWIFLLWVLLVVFGSRSGLFPLLFLGSMSGGGRYHGGGFGGGGFGGGGLGGGGGFSGGGASGGW